MRCTAIVHVDYRSERCGIRCTKPATWHAPAGAQVKEAWLCDEHRAAYIEACSAWCHRDGWQWPEPITRPAAESNDASQPTTPAAG
jgi:hypothetical protein